MRKSVLATIEEGTSFLDSLGVEDARLEAELLLAFLFRKNRLEVFQESTRLLTKSELDKYRNLLQERKKLFLQLHSTRDSLEALTSQVKFCGLDLEINPTVFIPHPETEVITRRAIKLMRDLPQPKIVDLGTGNGAIALSIAYHLQQAQVWAVDISPQAIRLARRNGEKHDLLKRVTFIEGNMFDVLPSHLKNACQLIISNPPFVPVSEILDLKSRFKFKPSPQALVAGEDGLGYHRLIIEMAPEYLQSGSYVILEIGIGQAEKIRQIFGRDWQIIEVVKDSAGRDRGIISQWINNGK